MIAYFYCGWLQFFEKRDSIRSICDLLYYSRSAWKMQAQRIMNSLYFRAFRFWMVLDKSLKIWQNRDIICKGHCASRMIDRINLPAQEEMTYMKCKKWLSVVLCCSMFCISDVSGFFSMNTAAVSCGCVSVMTKAEADMQFTYDTDTINRRITITGVKCSDISKITSITIPETIADMPVRGIGYMAFRNYTALTSITLPNTLIGIGECAFYNCKSLTTVELPDSLSALDYRAFYGCTGLTSVVIPDSVTRIGEETFKMCTNLTDVNIPQTVDYIGKSAFEGCESLTGITLPASVLEIERKAFADCDNLASVTLYSWFIHIADDAFAPCNTLYGYYHSDVERYAVFHKIPFVVLDAVTTTTTTAPVMEERLGDINADGQVSVADAVLLARILVEDKQAGYAEKAVTDINADGLMTIADVSEILQMLTS